jgi:PAS domain S-box-containing protein
MAYMLGHTPAEMLGKPLFAFMDERGRQLAEQNVERRKQGIREQHDFEFIRKDGERIYARLETAPILDEAGQYAGAIAAVADITERRKAEEEVLRLNAELEQRVRDRTKELERRNYELEQMNKAFVGRELKMVELKERIKGLEKKSV